MALLKQNVNSSFYLQHVYSYIVTTPPVGKTKKGGGINGEDVGEEEEKQWRL